MCGFQTRKHHKNIKYLKYIYAFSNTNRNWNSPHIIMLPAGDMSILWSVLDCQILIASALMCSWITYMYIILTIQSHGSLNRLIRDPVPREESVCCWAQYYTIHILCIEKMLSKNTERAMHFRRSSSLYSLRLIWSEQNKKTKTIRSLLLRCCCPLVLKVTHGSAARSSSRNLALILQCVWPSNHTHTTTLTRTHCHIELVYMHI